MNKMIRPTILTLLGLLTVVTAFGQPRTFEAHPFKTLGTRTDRTASLAFGDLDGDGDLDAVVANGRHWAQQNEVFINNGTGSFTLSRPLGEERATSYAVPWPIRW